jgi:predicted MPP superfamily phosphohydrolase
MLTFFFIVHALWAALHAYVAMRIVAPLELGRAARTAWYLLAALLAGASPLVLFADLMFAAPYNTIYRWLSWIYIGGFSTLFALIFARDLSWWTLLLVDRVRARRHEEPLLPPSPERRRFLLRASGGAAVGLSSALTAWGVHAARKAPQVVEVEVPIAGLPRAFDGYHIVQLSDVHVGETIDKGFILPIVEQVTSLAPDLIALTGDLVDGSVDKLRADISPFAYLRARDGVLCITGNHEYYSGAEEWCARFRELGLTVLINQHVVVARGASKLLFAGVTDIREGKRVAGHSSDPKAALAGAPPHDVRILLAHQPRSAYAAAPLGYKLQLSGHTHGGQFFPWNLLVGLVQPLSKGLGKIEGMWVYVNRGTCYWGPPNRTGVAAEITSLRLRSA